MNDFLTQAGWQDAQRIPLAGDASARRYTRLVKGDATAILMQDPQGDVDLFARLARHLNGLGLSAPAILAQSEGLLLLEDLGDGLIARLADTPQQEHSLYLVAVDALLELHNHAAPAGLPIASPEYLSSMTDVAFDCYATGAGWSETKAKAETARAFKPVLEQYAPPQGVMVLRDYHAENILWLPDRPGAKRAGLLDFQDALQGHPAYDLISLIEDARRDVSPETARRCIDHYLSRSTYDRDGFETALAVLGAQRNLRILGVFARLAATRGKPQYVDLIPRVWTHLQNDLKHPALSNIRSLLDQSLPEPTDDILQRLKS